MQKLFYGAAAVLFVATPVIAGDANGYKSWSGAIPSDNGSGIGPIGQGSSTGVEPAPNGNGAATTPIAQPPTSDGATPAFRLRIGGGSGSKSWPGAIPSDNGSGIGPIGQGSPAAEPAQEVPSTAPSGQSSNWNTVTSASGPAASGAATAIPPAGGSSSLAPVGQASPPAAGRAQEGTAMQPIGQPYTSGNGISVSAPATTEAPEHKSWSGAIPSDNGSGIGPM